MGLLVAFQQGWKLPGWAEVHRGLTPSFGCGCAGLEEYAAPIIDAIDPTGKLIAGRLYRPACKRTPHHQCVKDLGMLGRPLSR
jgi:hypothetical protein